MNENYLAGASEPAEVEPVASEVREIFPVQFDRDVKDFRPVDRDGEEVAPKASSAPDFATSQEFVTGLEDVSSEDVARPVLQNVERDISQGILPGSGSPLFSKEI